MSNTFIKQRNPNPGEQIMGLENFNFVLFPDSETTIEIPYINNRFKLGSSTDPKHKFGLAPKVQEEFENFFGVKFDSEEGQKFLEDWRIKISHLSTPIDMKDMEHKFNYTILTANDGLGLVNIGQKDDTKYFPFVLVDEEQELEQKVSRKVTRNEALSVLREMQLKNKSRLIKIAKYLFNLNLELNEMQAYDKLDSYIMENYANGEQFLKVVNLDEEWIDTMVVVKDAMTLQIIRRSEDGVYVNFANNCKLGRTLEEVVRYLNNPENQDQLGTGGKNDQPYSIRYQIKNKLQN